MPPMRTLLFAYGLLTLLSGCSKDNSPSSTSTSAVNSTCPTLDGTYSGLTGAGESIIFTFTTERSGTLTSYTFAEGNARGTYAIPADGSKLTGQTDSGPVTLSLSCGRNSLIMQTQTGTGAAVNMTYTDLGSNQILAETAGQSIRLARQ
jgi:hypothetical protein